MTMREEFEARFPVPAGVFWDDAGRYAAIGREWAHEAERYRAMLEAWQAARQSVPEGMVLVPKVPTEAMLAATSWPGCAAIDYAHMLAAIPQEKGRE